MRSPSDPRTADLDRRLRGFGSLRRARVAEAEEALREEPAAGVPALCRLVERSARRRTAALAVVGGACVCWRLFAVPLGALSRYTPSLRSVHAALDATLVPLAVAVALYLCAQWPFERRAARALAGVPDRRALVPLLASLSAVGVGFRALRRRREVVISLTALLADLDQTDASVLTRAQVRDLARVLGELSDNTPPLDPWYRDYCLAVLHVLTLVGSGEHLLAVRALHDFRWRQDIRDAAHACEAALEVRAAREEEQARLVRAAAPGSDGLLRPAEDHGRAAEGLTRPVEGEACEQTMGRSDERA